uniref:Uncharacterized protein n=1 Tax=Parascaris univalens TaxID=6257 RepID=A0A915BH48_PARUN
AILKQMESTSRASTKDGSADQIDVGDYECVQHSSENHAFGKFNSPYSAYFLIQIFFRNKQQL